MAKVYRIDQARMGAASDWDKAREVESSKWKVESGKKRLEPDALFTFHFSPIFAREPVSPISRLHLARITPEFSYDLKR
jgi:hypothetical protein